MKFLLEILHSSVHQTRLLWSKSFENNWQGCRDRVLYTKRYKGKDTREITIFKEKYSNRRMWTWTQAERTRCHKNWIFFSWSWLLWCFNFSTRFALKTIHKHTTNYKLPVNHVRNIRNGVIKSSRKIQIIKTEWMIVYAPRSEHFRSIDIRHVNQTRKKIDVSNQRIKTHEKTIQLYNIHNKNRYWLE